ncbi:MAG: patatin-like phospholipase family protein [Pseudomonadota bacterium]|nr:patatin-like phospholipase family protein [Pseudomonadota bacterium]
MAVRAKPGKCREVASADRHAINLALQGGGSHGAFTWGVLDVLLEDGRLSFEGVSGTSAGAMNAVVLAHGLAKAAEDGLSDAEARQATRDALARFWGGVGTMGTLMSGIPLPPGAQSFFNLWGQMFTPAQTNPWGLNPLRRLLEREVDFDRLAAYQPTRAFVCATNVNTGRGEIFGGKRLSADAVMASACLPMLFQTVMIDGQPYWDGGYAGNPAIYPLIYDTQSSDVLLVQINPVEVNFDPNAGAHEIMERMNEITFNSSLLAEMRAIAFVRRLLEDNKLDAQRYKRVLLHRVDGGSALSHFGASSKQRATSSFVNELFTLGRQAGAAWLRRHCADVGVRDSVAIATSTYPDEPEDD